MCGVTSSCGSRGTAGPRRNASTIRLLDSGARSYDAVGAARAANVRVKGSTHPLARRTQPSVPRPVRTTGGMKEPSLFQRREGHAHTASGISQSRLAAQAGETTARGAPALAADGPACRCSVRAGKGPWFLQLACAEGARRFAHARRAARRRCQDRQDRRSAREPRRAP